METSKLQERLRRIEQLVSEFETMPDASVRATGVEIVQLLMEFHGEGLERMTRIIASIGENGEGLLREFAADDLIAHLLLLYGLHPDDVQTRVQRALAKVRPQLSAHGGDAQLRSIQNGVVRLSLEGSCQQCLSSTATLKLAVEKAIYEAAPEVMEIVAEGLQPESHPTSGGFKWQSS